MYCDGDALRPNKSIELHFQIASISQNLHTLLSVFSFYQQATMKVQLLEESRKAKPIHSLLGQQQNQTSSMFLCQIYMVYYSFVGLA
jgi:hypothetical protein